MTRITHTHHGTPLSSSFLVDEDDDDEDEDDDDEDDIPGK
jgi:hypothetical protein